MRVLRSLAPATSTKTLLNKALRGNAEEFIAASSEAVLTGWDSMDQDTRKALGGKVEFRKVIEASLRDTVTGFVDIQKLRVAVNAALQSKIIVGVVSTELPHEPERIQEIELTIHSKDLDLIVDRSEG